MPTGATGMLCLHLHCWNKRHYFSFVLHFNTHTLVFTFLDSFVAEMVNSQPAYIIKCTWATRHRHRFAVLMFFQWHHPSHLFISISPGTFWVKSCCFFTSFFCFCKEEKKSPIQILESLYIRVAEQHGCTLKCLHYKLDAEALSTVFPYRITLTGCWQKRQLDLTKQKESIPTGLKNNRDKSCVGAAGWVGWHQSAQVSLKKCRQSHIYLNIVKFCSQ